MPATITSRPIFLLAFAALTILAFASTRAEAQQAPHTNTYERNMLVLSTIAAINNANLSGNYTILHQMASPEFQRANPPARLAQIFARQRAARLDFTPALLYSPVFKPTNRVTRRDLLHLRGTVHTQPLQLEFDFLYKWTPDQRWRIVSMSLNPVAYQPPARQDKTPKPHNAKSWTKRLSNLFD